MPALAAQLRAFSSLLSLPSQAQSVIKAFRRQGIGSADEFNTARFFLSRIESLSALLQVFQIFRGRAELAASRPMARLCALFRCAPQIPQTRLTHASALARWWFLVNVCACGGKTLISRMNVSASATCRGLTSLPPMAFVASFRLCFADAKTVPKHHRPTHIRPLEPHHFPTFISRPKGILWVYIFFRDGPYQVLICYLCV